MGLIAGVLRDDDGAVVTGASVYVYTVDTTTPVTLYSNRTLTTPITNPLTSGSAGEYAAYAADGIVDLHVVATGHADVDIPDVPVSDPQNYAWLAGKAGGQTLNLDTASGATTGKISSTSHATKGKWHLNSAGTITVDEFNLRVGVGRNDPQSQFHNYHSNNGNVESLTETASTANAGAATYRAKATAADAQVKAYSSGSAATLMGYAAASFGAVFQSVGSGLIVGTSHNAAVIVGTQGIERLNISGAGVGVWNETGADADFRMEGDTEQNLFFLDAGADRMGWGTATPSTTHHVLRTNDGTTEFRNENSNAAGTSAQSVVKAIASTASVSLVSHGAARVATRYGVTVGNYSEVVLSAGSGLLMGTATATPLVLGTNDAERARILSSGEFLIGRTTAPTSGQGAWVGTLASDAHIFVSNLSSTGFSGFSMANHSGTTAFFFGVDNANSRVRMNATSSFPWVFMTQGVERMRLDSAGNILINSAPAAGTSAVGVLAIANGTAPSTGPADMIQLYSSDDSAGNTIPSWWCEGSGVVATGQADSASSVRVKMRINGTVRTFLCI